jgi:hypothetical protein
MSQLLMFKIRGSALQREVMSKDNKKESSVNEGGKGRLHKSINRMKRNEGIFISRLASH